MNLNVGDGLSHFGDDDGDGGDDDDASDARQRWMIAVALPVDDLKSILNKIHYCFLSVVVVVVVIHLFSLFFVPQFLYFYFHENSLTTSLGPPTWYVVGDNPEGR